jgi:WD40 repeat protein
VSSVGIEADGDLDLGRVNKWISGLLRCLAVSPDSRTLVAGSLGGDAMMVDIATGNALATLPDHPLGVLVVAWAPSGERVATSGQEGTLRLHGGDGCTVVELSAGGWLHQLEWSRRGELAAAAGWSLMILGHDGAVVHRYPPVQSTITAVRWSSNATRVGVTSYGGITWYDTDRLPNDGPSRHHPFKGSPLSLALSGNGKWACCGYQDASIHVWPLWSGDDLAMSGYPAKIEHLAFRDDSQWLASACLDELTVWDFSGRGPKGGRPAIGDAHAARISWLGWQPGGDLLASGGQNGDVIVWPSPTSTRKPLMPTEDIAGTSAAATAAWLPDGRGLIVGRHDGTVELRTSVEFRRSINAYRPTRTRTRPSTSTVS